MLNKASLRIASFLLIGISVFAWHWRGLYYRPRTAPAIFQPSRSSIRSAAGDPDLFFLFGGFRHVVDPLHDYGSTFGTALSSLSEAGEFSLDVDWDSLSEVGLTRDTPVSVNQAWSRPPGAPPRSHDYGTALSDVLYAADPTLTKIRFGETPTAIVVSTPARIAQLPVLHRFVIDNLISKPSKPQPWPLSLGEFTPEELLQRIKQRIDPDSWKTLLPVAPNSEGITIFQSRQNHQRIAQELEYLRWQKFHLQLVLPLINHLAWCLALAIGRELVLMLKRRRDRQMGLCAHCGYDLRATPQRCPECGTVPRAIKSVSA